MTQKEQIINFIKSLCTRNSKGQVFMDGCYLTLISPKDSVTLDDGLIKFFIEHEITHVKSYRDFSDSDSNVACIGFSSSEQKWYGWSHRAIYGFGIGYIAKEGDSCTTSGWTDEYLEEHPEADLRVPVGFEVKTLADAKRCAIAFAESVS